MTLADVAQQYLTPTRLSDMSQALSRGENPLDRDASIIAQSSGKDAAEMTSALIGAGVITDTNEIIQVYTDLKTAVFNSTIALAGAESVVEKFEDADERPARRSTGGGGGGYGNRGGGGGGYSDDAGAGVVIKFGKYQGKTIGQVYDEDPDYIEWLADKGNNQFLKNKAREFLAAA